MAEKTRKESTGRPKIGAEKMVSLGSTTITTELKQKFDDCAKKMGFNRSELMRHVLTQFFK